MFDKLDSVIMHYEEIERELASPGIASDQSRFRKLMKEQSDLVPIVTAYREYRECRAAEEESLQLLEEESDEEMRELAKEELATARSRTAELEEEIKILLLPKDPNDDKNVIVEIRAGAGGDEAALFAAEVYRMYVHYAENRGWKTEILDFEEIGDVSGAVARECFRRGLVIERSGRNDCVLKLMPALTITEEELAEGLEIIRESMKTILGGNRP